MEKNINIFTFPRNVIKNKLFIIFSKNEQSRLRFSLSQWIWPRNVIPIAPDWLARIGDANHRFRIGESLNNWFDTRFQKLHYPDLSPILQNSWRRLFNHIPTLYFICVCLFAIAALSLNGISCIFSTETTPIPITYFYNCTVCTYTAALRFRLLVKLIIETDFNRRLFIKQQRCIY